MSTEAILSIIAIWLEVAFLPWYVTMIAILWRSLRDPETGALDRITLGMVAVLVYGLAHTVLLIDDFWQLQHPADRLIGRIGLDIFRAVAVTYFMWHLRVKEILAEWLNDDRE